MQVYQSENLRVTTHCYIFNFCSLLHRERALLLISQWQRPPSMNAIRQFQNDHKLTETPTPTYGINPFGVIPYPTCRPTLKRFGLVGSRILTVVMG